MNDCVLKHLSACYIYLKEYIYGYDKHRWKAIGHLVCAEEEVSGLSFGHQIRELRLLIMEDKVENFFEWFEKL